MERNEQSETSVMQIKEVIDRFLAERLKLKLDKLKEDEIEKRQQLIDVYKPENWIPDAARRAGQIQQITHALKYVHPDAKGSNLNSPGNTEAGELLIGTHSLARQVAPDVVGNAAALDVYKFLRLEVNGKSLLSRAIENDPELQQAFSVNDGQATEWMSAFANVINSKGGLASHKLAKQLFWPMKVGEYHLLSPLFPTSLVHEVWGTIRENRFSEEAKAAREARRAGNEHPHGYCEYPMMVIQQFGGTKPQNISQLNSERYGENYLLPSLPPHWNSEPVKPPLRVESVFDGWFGRRPRVRELVRVLRDFLYSLREEDNNMRIRNKRIELVGYIVDEILLFAAELQDLEGNWTLLEDCRLNIDEQCWFNPERAKTDPDFAAIFTWGDWKEMVCKRFANWLNAQLLRQKKALPFGEDEAGKWEADLDKALAQLRMEVGNHE